MAADPSSTNIFGIREEDVLHGFSMNKSFLSPSSAPTSSHAATPVKKKRNLPGNPDPDAEVIALSPKTLMTTNRYICEVCNKGFQREQNLQLHRRGHNLPWKLRQKSTKEVRRRVYLCPEPTCVHHDPSRALGDLTGIKKHYYRKHGEKKWKCEKCSKRYAVQSDCKAHFKTCGTREYRCDCGTPFSRRDSFISHRAFCDVLAQESSRLPPCLNHLGSQIYGNTNMGLNLPQITTLQDQTQPSPDLLRLNGLTSQFDHIISQSDPSSSFISSQHTPSSSFYLSEDTPPHHTLLQSKPFQGLMQLPDLHSNTNANPFNFGFFSSSTNNINNSTSNDNGEEENVNIAPEPMTLFSDNLMSSLYNPSMQTQSVHPQMSATALLKASQICGSSNEGSSLIRGFGSSSSSRGQNPMNMFRMAGGEPNYGGFHNSSTVGSIGVPDGFTRDFLGVGSMVRSMGSGISQREHHHGFDIGFSDPKLKSVASSRSFIGFLDPEMKSGSSSRSFLEGNLQ